MGVQDRKYLSSTLVAVAGCKSVTFRAWRNRNGLFPETLADRGWNYFSLVDICLVRAVVVMTESGIPADDAIWQAQGFLRHYIAGLLSGKSSTHVHAFFQGGTAPISPLPVPDNGGPIETKAWSEPRCTFMALDGNESVLEVLKRTKGAVTIIDLHPIVDHVLSEIAALQPETIATAQETLQIVAGALAEALRPQTEEEEG